MRPHLSLAAFSLTPSAWSLWQETKPKTKQNSAEAGEARAATPGSCGPPSLCRMGGGEWVGRLVVPFPGRFPRRKRDPALRCAAAALRGDLFEETSEAVSLVLELTARSPEPRGSRPREDALLSGKAGGRISPAF